MQLLGFSIFLLFIALAVIQIITWSVKRKIIAARNELGIKQPFIDKKLYNLSLMNTSLTKEEIAKFLKELQKSFELARKLDFVRIILFFVLIGTSFIYNTISDITLNIADSNLPSTPI